MSKWIVALDAVAVLGSACRLCGDVDWNAMVAKHHRPVG